MSKSKKNKRGMAEKLANKSKPAKLNPFDVRVTKEKHKILGRKMKKEVGKPGISRAKAIQKRKDTLLQEFRMKDKSNMFHDKRIGEKDTALSAEDKMIARFTAERLKGSGKQSIFSLGDDDTDLTHGGVNINSIHQFDNPHSDEDEEEEAKLNAKFVDEAHFGGFMTRRDDEFAAGKSNARKEWIDELIKESKKRKAEKQKDQEETADKTRELDDNWKSLLPSIQEGKCGMGGKFYTKGEDTETDVKKEPYDLLVRELGFEKKEARGSVRLKTDEEVIKEERERLERLEADRLRRMRGEDVDEMERRHRSVEEVVEGGRQAAEDTPMLAYKDGVLVKGQKVFEKPDDKDEEDDVEGGESEEEDDDEDDEEEEEDDNYSDLESDTEEAETEKPDRRPAGLDRNEKDEYDERRLRVMNEASAEIPYVFAVPDTYEELAGHLEGRPVADRKVIVERIVKCNHPQLGEGNRQKLEGLFTHLLQYVQDCAAAYDPDEGAAAAAAEEEESLQRTGLAAVDMLTPLLFQLTGMFQQHAAKSVLHVLTEKFEEVSGLARMQLPGLDTLVFLKLACLLFPASDYRHALLKLRIALNQAIKPCQRVL